MRRSKNATTVRGPTAGATIGGFVRVDGEFMFITAITGFQLEVRSRGSFGGIAVDHGTSRR
jgi:hypothetical protein